MGELVVPLKHLLEYSAKSFSVPCAPLSMLGSHNGTGCDGVKFLVDNGWNSRDVSMADKCDCVKECMSFIM